MKTSINEIEINGEKYVKKSDVKTIDKPSGDYVVVRTYSAGVRGDLPDHSRSYLFDYGIPITAG